MRVSISGLYSSNRKVSDALPFTDNLVINRKGVITDTKEATQLKPLKKANGYWVNLPIKGAGKLTIKVATLTSIVFKGNTLHWTLWRDISLFYKDDNCFNVDPNNIAHQMYPEHFKYTIDGIDYKIIPNFTKYGISQLGIIYSVISDGIILGNSNHGSRGYKQFKLKSDLTGKHHNVGRHRLLGICYKIGPELSQLFSKTVDDMVVNHLNHTPGSDELTNLEWCTYSENNQHSINYGGRIPDSFVPVISYDMKLSVYKLHASTIACADYIKSAGGGTFLNQGDELTLQMGRYRVGIFDTNVVYDATHPMAKTPPTTRNYSSSGVWEVYDLDGNLVIKTSMLEDLIKLFNLNYKPPYYSGFRKKFARGSNSPIPNHTVRLSFFNYPIWYGGTVFK